MPRLPERTAPTRSAEVTDTLLRPGEVVVDRLTWRPYGRDEPALRDVSLTIAPGERLLLVGASGAGKSTLLRAMGGLLDPALGERSGHVTLSAPAGTPGAAALLLQDPSHSVVAEHVGRDAAFGPENRALPPPQVRTVAAASLADVQFPYGADHRTDALSGGELQRLALAGAMAVAPGVLLLDEPTAMLDPASALTVRTAVLRAASEHDLSLVVAEHRLDGWIDLCRRVVVLGPDGRILADGPTRQTLTDQTQALAAAGIWVPGLPAPAPVPITSGPPAGRVSRLRAEQLTVTEPGGPRVLLKDAHVDLRRGESLAVLGRSGSGKTTLLRTLAGLTAPAAGRIAIEVDGDVVDPHALRRRPALLAAAVAWLPQHAEQLFTRRTVRGELLATSEVIFAADPARLDRARADAESLLGTLGLTRLADADPFRLSGGEQRRVALAAIVTHRPAVVVLDEPTVGQDRHTWAAVCAVLDRLRTTGSVVVAATHDPLLAGRLDHTLDLDAASRGVPAPRPATSDYRVTEVVDPDSPLTARCNPVATLVMGLAAAVGSFWVTDWRVGLLTLVLSAVLTPLAVRHLRSLMRLVPVGVAALMVGWSTLLFSNRGVLTAAAVPVAAAEATRICCLVVPGALLMTGLRPSRLADALAQRLHLPPRPVVAATSALLRLQQLIDTWRRMADIRRIRGLDPGRSLPGRVRQVATMTFALLVDTLRSAQQMALSMDARGFAGARRRTFALASPWRGRDWLCLLGAAVLGATPLVLSTVLG